MSDTSIPELSGTVRTPRITLYLQFLERTRGLRFADYEALWRWSTTELDAFWQSLWEFFELESPTPHTAVRTGQGMPPGTHWFPGAQVNLAQQMLRHAEAAHAAGHPAIVASDERRMAAGASPAELSWTELRRRVACFAERLRAAGVQPGDRVCAILPNTADAVVAFYATAAVGAVWSVCSPDMGPVAVLDRFRQIAPKVLVAVDGQVWGHVAHDRRAVLREVLAGLPSVHHLVLQGVLDAGIEPADFAREGLATHRFDDWCAGAPAPGWAPEWLPFEHPLWIVYSS